MKTRQLTAPLLLIAALAFGNQVNAQTVSGATAEKISDSNQMSRIEKEVNGKIYQLSLSVGKVTGLSIDGKKIPESQWEAHRSEINLLKTQIKEDKLQAEKDQIQANADKAQADKDKVQAENDKIQGEKDKVQANKDKFQAEADKKQAFLDKKQAEKDRAQANLDKVQAEKDKKLQNRIKRCWRILLKIW